jgi:hypothetical protein
MPQTSAAFQLIEHTGRREAAFLLFATPGFQDQDSASPPHDREAVEYVQESGFSEGELAAYEKYWDGVSAEGELLGQQKVALKMLRKGLGVEEVSAIAEIDAEEVLRLSRLLQEFGPAAKEHCAR